MNINLNADCGESYGAWVMGQDHDLLQIVRSANIACGFHAGDPMVMRQTVRHALAAEVSLGAHPGYPDLHGFGRRAMHMAPDELEAALIYQIAALAGIANAEGGRLTHVKPHGALNNQAVEDSALSDVIARAVRAIDRDLILLAPALSKLHEAGQRAGLPVAAEIFADRSYTDAGTLTPRSEPGAMIHDPAEAVAHVLAMLDAQALVARSGRRLPTRIDSICVHGDSPGAVARAAEVRGGLLAAGLALATLPEIVGVAG